ncbi:hypothetical protein BA173_05115 [Rickettsia sp. MEAM1 (Bemisia tabaci)]|uniref:hypothetical protein n=1 Tax=unclassified Rickettsia TaxID=114295 RepID=UPI00031AF233|nr:MULTISPECIES: hypothetical protein [unclassified Rickettsia]ASX28187.1 hypothetical protein BA173_05115 [Rickettsia sp. MEAM1 (Bemisia tabaci)]ODA37654.1 hypothetical protein A8V33_05620 [Rickettsia sp. wb]ODA37768.1 hypothetical protein A8V34_02730 [Rickettsia sp. wq]
MTKYIPNLNLPPNSNENDIYNSITPRKEAAIIESLILQEKFQPLDLQFLKTASLLKKENSKSSNMLKHYVTSYDKEIIENIFRQAHDNGEKDLVAKMLEIEPKLERFCQKQELELVGDDQPPQDQV